ncbi:MAG: hypothetical protein ABIQ90_02095 [Polaromonas sp.]
MFKDDFKREWCRLNLQYIRPEDGLLATLAGAVRETLPGYFAPLRMLWWLIKYAKRQLL